MTAIEFVKDYLNDVKDLKLSAHGPEHPKDTKEGIQDILRFIDFLEVTKATTLEMSSAEFYRICCVLAKFIRTGIEMMEDLIDLEDENDALAALVDLRDQQISYLQHKLHPTPLGATMVPQPPVTD